MENHQLIELLAKTEALFEPIRDWSEPKNVAGICERRQAYLTRGIAWKVGGSGADRLAGHRAAEKLEASGDVLFVRQNGSRVGWKLDEACYWRLRWQCLLFGENDLVQTLAEMLEAVADGVVYGNSRFVPEFVLTGEPQTKKATCLIEEKLMPGLVMGWIDSHSDHDGRVAYQITNAGHTWLSVWQRPSFSPPEYKRQVALKCADIYCEAIQEARRELAGLKGAGVVIPLSSGIWPARKKKAKR